MSDEKTREEKNQVFQPPTQQQMSNVERQSGFEVPVETVPLPSRGIIYAPDHPLHMAKSIDIKAMTAKEEDLLTSQALIKNGTVLSKLLESCILNKLLDADTMITGDRNAILTALRITGYGQGYDIKIRCPECDKTFENTFDLSQIPVKPLGAEPLEPGRNLFGFKLPRSGKAVQFRLLTGADELELSRAARGRQKFGSQVEQGVTSRLLQSVVSIGEDRDPQKLAYAIQNMSAGDSRALRKYIDRVEPGLKMRQMIECEFCGEQSEVNVPLGLTFFWPDAGV